MGKPLLFISHKHKDARIAKRVAGFVRTVTGGSVDVFLSSSAGFDGPRAGKPLTKELGNALWKAGVVILVYTSQDEDWSWCMWECGKADEPASPDTKVVVLQCLPDKPHVFEGGVTVLAWDIESLVSLAYRFRQPGFFPGIEAPLTGLKDGELKEHAIQLHADLADLIPKEKPVNWSAWPFVRLEIPRAKVEAVHGFAEDARTDGMLEALLNHAMVTDVASGLLSLFGRVDLPRPSPFSELVEAWREHHRDRDEGWLDSLARQILEASRQKTPRSGSWARFPRVYASDQYVIGVGRTKKDATCFAFDCYFFGLGSVAGVNDRMTRRDKMFYIDLAKQDPDSVALVDLVKDLEGKDWRRVPILDGAAPKYIVHVSAIDRFLRLLALAEKDVSAATLGDLLADPGATTVFANTFGVVHAGASIADALKSMRATDRCADVFVIDDQQGVIGWLTDRDIPVDELRTL